MRRKIETSLRWAVFERNDEVLWARVRSTLEELLIAEWRGGALKGDTAEQAFFIKCDQSTMTTFDMARGELIVMVGLALIKPTEFAILRIQQNTVV